MDGAEHTAEDSKIFPSLAISVDTGGKSHHSSKFCKFEF